MAGVVVDAATVRSVRGTVNYISPTQERPRYYANAPVELDLVPHEVSISDVRSWADSPSLDREGFLLVGHKSDVRNFRDRAEVADLHSKEIASLLRSVSGADEVIVNWPRILRFSERSAGSVTLDNSPPARFAHVDFTYESARALAAQVNGKGYAKARRLVQYNVWRAITPPPQDAPLTVCDARTVRFEDLVVGEAVYDPKNGAPEYSFEGYLVRHDPGHRWAYYSNMTVDEALVFKTYDSAASSPAGANCVPHTAFEDSSFGSAAMPRGSIEMRGLALWY